MRRSPLNKKGSRVLFMVVELLLVVVAVFFIFDFAIRAGSSEEVAIDTVASEFSHMINVMAGDSHTIKAGYPADLSKYGLILNPDSIKVYLISGAETSTDAAGATVKFSETLSSEKSFVLPSGWSASGAVEGAASVCLIRENPNSLIILRACDGVS